MGQEARNGEAEAPKWEARPQTASDVWNRADFGSPGSLRKLAEAFLKNRPPLCPSCKKDTPWMEGPRLDSNRLLHLSPSPPPPPTRLSPPPPPIIPSPRIASLNTHVYGEALSVSGGHVVPHPADSAQPGDMAKEVPYLALDVRPNA
ncbi:hypothetical protein BDN71DRAFT_1591578 [Pleurotus eryngii]|uniref:Uncharacterized protein n=1 Tax=Pleurotus eryngii TaxID=5323 RepID=A0A9P5ZRV8_PLEER|nr:hypothetical protein BDN71DRAFT_1591578 [Pleurotus eryngii]